jgi:hypothetical protein
MKRLVSLFLSLSLISSSIELQAMRDDNMATEQQKPNSNVITLSKVKLGLWVGAALVGGCIIGIIASKNVATILNGVKNVAVGAFNKQPHFLQDAEIFVVTKPIMYTADGVTILADKIHGAAHGLHHNTHMYLDKDTRKIKVILDAITAGNNDPKNIPNLDIISGGIKALPKKIALNYSEQVAQQCAKQNPETNCKITVAENIFTEYLNQL